MAWRIQDVAAPGEYVACTVAGGAMIDLLGVNTQETLLSQVRAYARGWTVTHVEWDRQLFGIGETMRFYGRADSSIPVAAIAGQVRDALNSQWTIAGADVVVYVSDSLTSPVPQTGGSWSTTLQLISIAVIAVAVVWGISQIRSVANE